MWFTTFALLVIIGVRSHSDEIKIVEKAPRDRQHRFSESRNEHSLRAEFQSEVPCHTHILNQFFRIEESTALVLKCPQLQMRSWVEYSYELLHARALSFGAFTIVPQILRDFASRSTLPIAPTASQLSHKVDPSSSETLTATLFSFSDTSSSFPTSAAIITTSSSFPSPSPTHNTTSSSFPSPSPTHNTTSSSFPSPSPAHNTTSSTVPTTTPTHNTTSSSSSSPSPTHNTTSTVPTTTPTHNTTSSTVPSPSPTHNTTSSSVPTASLTHNTSSSSVPTATPTHSTTSSTVPTVSPSHNTTSSSVPTVSPTHNTSSSSVPTVSPTHNTSSSAVPTASPSHNTSSSSVPTASPTHNTSSSIVPTASPATTPPTFSNTSSSSVPSLSPTESFFGIPPTGVSGVDYWYLVSAYCTLYGVDELTDDVVLSAQSAFKFALTDGMNIHDSERVQVLAERPDDVITSLALLNNLHHSLVFHELPQRDRISKDRDREMLLDTSIRRGSNRIKIEEEKEKQSVGVAIRSWSPSLLIARNVIAAFNLLHNNSLLVIIPMHEQNVHSVTGISVKLTQRTITLDGPLLEISSHQLSPMRLFFVIIGTICVFSLIVSLLFHAKRHFERHPDTSAFLRNKSEVIVRNLKVLGVHLVAFFSHWHRDFLSRRRREGFHEAPQDEENGSSDADDCAVELSELHEHEQPNSKDDLNCSCIDTEDSIEYADADNEACIVHTQHIRRPKEEENSVQECKCLDSQVYLHE